LERKFFEYQRFVDVKVQIQTGSIVIQIIDNVLCFSMRRTSEVALKEIFDIWFVTPYQPNEINDTCLRILDEKENIS